MSLEWFDRVSGELQDHLESICGEYDQIGHMSVERGAKYPRIEFFIELEEEERDYFCTLSFDAVHEEFFFEQFDTEYGQTCRTLLEDIEDIVDYVHESLHEHLNEGFEVVVETDSDDFDDDDYYEDEEADDIFEEIDVEWETPEVTAYIHEDEVEVTYQFGIIKETGDGVIKRINRIWTSEEDLLKDESHFIFSKEEASTIIALIASHMDSMSNFNFDEAR